MLAEKPKAREKHSGEKRKNSLLFRFLLLTVRQRIWLNVNINYFVLRFETDYSFCTFIVTSTVHTRLNHIVLNLSSMYLL